MNGSTLSFLGGAGTVTGSKYLVTDGPEQYLLDCGLFQGLKPLRLRNWASPTFSPRQLSAVVLSHAHLDHCGYLPILVRHGFRGPIHCTAPTVDLARLVLEDSARIQEEDADRRNRHHTTKHDPALPLYTAAEVAQTMALFEAHRFGKDVRLGRHAQAHFRRAGHILGAASVELRLGQGPTRLVFSGDLGRWHRPIVRDPELVEEADVLLVESTYGDRLHSSDAEAELARVVTTTAERGGVVVIPAFAIGRTQELLWVLGKLERERRVPVLPVILDSPMAERVTQVYARHTEEHDLDLLALSRERENPLETKRFTSIDSGQGSRALNSRHEPMVIIAGSGMATGGRVVQHLKHRLPDARNTVLLSGFQAAGTRGRALQDGAPSVKIDGQFVTVKAQVAALDGLSAHADQSELLRWLAGFRQAPRMTYVVHGEPSSAAALQARIQKDLGWPVTVAVDQATVPLPGSGPR